VTSGQLLRKTEPQEREVSSLSVPADGKWFATADWGEIKIWETEGLRISRKFGEDASSISVSPDGQWLASVTKESIRIRNLRTGALIRSIPFKKVDVLSTAASPNSEAIVTAGYANPTIWRVGDGKQMQQLQQKPFQVKPGWRSPFTIVPPFTTEAVAYSPDGRWIASAGEITNIYDSRTRGANHQVVRRLRTEGLCDCGLAGRKICCRGKR
jgi:WD40 repeat protein